MPAEIVFADNGDAPWLLGVHLRGAAQLPAVRPLIVRQTRNVRHSVGIGFTADDEEGGSECHLVVSNPTQALDNSACFLATQRPQLPGEDHGLAAKRVL